MPCAIQLDQWMAAQWLLTIMAWNVHSLSRHLMILREIDYGVRSKFLVSAWSIFEKTKIYFMLRFIRKMKLGSIIIHKKSNGFHWNVKIILLCNYLQTFTGEYCVGSLNKLKQKDDEYRPYSGKGRKSFFITTYWLQ